MTGFASTGQVVFERLFPLYSLVLIGFILGRALAIDAASVAKILIYFITPAVIWSATATQGLTWSWIALPVGFFAICVTVCLLALIAGRKIWGRDSLANLAAFASGNGNSGYFGLPVSLALVGDRALGPAVICSFGFILYENTLGYFVTARGHHSIGDSLRKVARLPAVYAFVIGCACHAVGWPGHRFPAIDELMRNVRGTYSVLGMMMIGLAAAGVSGKAFRQAFDVRFNAFCLAFKFIAWPVIGRIWVLLDRTVFNLFDEPTREVIVILSAIPMAANTVAIAAALNLHPEKAAIAVLVSTIVVLGVLPIALAMSGF